MASFERLCFHREVSGKVGAFNVISRKGATAVLNLSVRVVGVNNEALGQRVYRARSLVASTAGMALSNITDEIAFIGPRSPLKRFSEQRGWYSVVHSSN